MSQNMGVYSELLARYIPKKTLKNTDSVFFSSYKLQVVNNQNTGVRQAFTWKSYIETATHKWHLLLQPYLIHHAKFTEERGFMIEWITVTRTRALPPDCREAQTELPRWVSNNAKFLAKNPKKENPEGLQRCLWNTVELSGELFSLNLGPETF